MTEKTQEIFKTGAKHSGIPIVGLLVGTIIVFLYVLLRISPEMFREIFGVIGILSPIWVPLFLGYIFFKFWMIYVRANFFKNQEYVFLEVKLPREIMKSPLAMESVFMGLHQGIGEQTWFDRWWLGKTRTWYSFEIVSIEGQVRFFIWSRAFFKEMIETQIYAQYPDVEIVEADDYTRMIDFDLQKISVWGTDFSLRKPDAYPIKTYIDYGLDKDPKEEHKIDPMAPMIEHFGSLGKGEQLWLQFLIRVNKDEKKKKGLWPFGKRGWKDDAQDEINKLMLRDPKTKSSREISSAGFPFMPSLSEGEKDIIKAIERSITKLGFDVGIRGIYLSEKDKFRPINIVGLLSVIKQFNSNTLNQFTPAMRYNIPFNYPWQDYKGILRARASRRVYDAYRRRSYFFHPYKTQPLVFNTEELATMYHFPGSVVQTPTVSRVPSKKSEAPSDLPI
ncbi:MAG: hypothetical protein QGG63_00580 [Candidatus Pacebacteria bacterium]|jgi:hypothetical protein|nr:hypothetical protein [Candidatus Paceibacterota bacterium]|tara:strand:- start:20913 stop:22253 length:1341 start_codon:yes stop_codon:yes gene_type:complete